MPFPLVPRELREGRAAWRIQGKSVVTLAVWHSSTRQDQDSAKCRLLFWALMCWGLLPTKDCDGFQQACPSLSPRNS